MGYPGLFNSSYIPNPAEVYMSNHAVGQMGPILLADILVSLLQGIMIVQYNDYVRHYWSERRWTKWLVHAAFILCTLKFAYVWWLAWDKLVKHHGDWFYLSLFSPITVPIGISTTIPTAVCQVYYIHRCWILSRNWIFLISAILSLIITVGGGIALTVGATLLSQGKMTSIQLNIVSADITLSSGLACDVFITAFTCNYLLREKTGFKETDGLVVRLVKTSIESAAGPTIVALINLILSNMLATIDQWFLFPNLILAHVYGCSLLYCVNARRSMDTTRVITAGLPSSGSGSRFQSGSESSRAISFLKVSSNWRSNQTPNNQTISTDNNSNNSSVIVELHTIRREEMNAKDFRNNLVGEKSGPSPNAGAKF